MVIRKRVEVKYQEPVSQVVSYIHGQNVGSSTAPNYKANWGQWWSFMPQTLYSPQRGVSSSNFAPTSTDCGNYSFFNVGLSTTDTGNNIFEKSLFAPGGTTDPSTPGISQGPGTFQRIGRQIHVVKDKWNFEVYINPRTTGSGTASSFGHGSRAIRLRLVCVYRKTLPLPGTGFLHPLTVFENVNDIHSPFKADHDSYSVVYDKTKKLGMNIPQNWVDNVYHYNQTREPNHPQRVHFSFSATPYLLEWEDRNSTGRVTNLTQHDIDPANASFNPTSPGGLTQGGQTKGHFQWFVFCEDEFCDTLRVGSVGPIYNIHPQSGMKFKVRRVLKYTDM